MTAILIVLLVLSALGFLAVAYSLKEAWKDYTLALQANGWTVKAARSQVRAQAYRLIEVGLLFAVVALGIAFPSDGSRPTWVLTILRTGIILVIVLISVSAIIDVKARRDILRGK